MARNDSRMSDQSGGGGQGQGARRKPLVEQWLPASRCGRAPTALSTQLCLLQRLPPSSRPPFFLAHYVPPLDFLPLGGLQQSVLKAFFILPARCTSSFFIYLYTFSTVARFRILLEGSHTKYSFSTKKKLLFMNFFESTQNCSRYKIKWGRYLIKLWNISGSLILRMK